MHLQFAYYESSLVVKYLVSTYGLDAMKQVLPIRAAGVHDQCGIGTPYGVVGRPWRPGSRNAPTLAEVGSPKTSIGPMIRAGVKRASSKRT